MQDKYKSIHYAEYLRLDKILDAQEPRSRIYGKEAHDETLFIIVHQAYELWFKQILHEITSIYHIFGEEYVNSQQLYTILHQLIRVNKILKLLIQQVEIIETMTPHDFLSFRNYLIPASGHQSLQFRKLEVMLGLKADKRINYTVDYRADFNEQQQQELNHLENSASLLEKVGSWLERTPFLSLDQFDFITQYKAAIVNMIARERHAILEVNYLTEAEKSLRLKMLDDSQIYYNSFFDAEVHQKLVNEGGRKLSQKALLGALLINLYREEPILQIPFSILSELTDMDENLTMWRFRHAQMTLKMLGKKMGTGGSSGHDYLRVTVERHRFFSDLFLVSTLLIPREDLPKLPPELKSKLAFHYEVIH